MPALPDPRPHPPPTAAAPPRGIAGRRSALEGFVPTTPAAIEALGPVRAALGAPRLSLDALRDAVVRYGRVAREVALAPEEMLAALVPLARRIADAHQRERPELATWVEWWAIHGYHRAD